MKTRIALAASMLLTLMVVPAAAGATPTSPTVPTPAGQATESDPTGDAKPGGDCHPDITSFGGSYTNQLVTLTVTVACPSDPNADPNWRSPRTEIDWIISEDYAGADFSVTYFNRGGELHAFLTSNAGDLTCDAQPGWDGDKTFSASFAPACIETPDSFQVAMAARYDVGDCGLPTSSGPCPDDIAPDKQGDFGRVIAPDGAPIPPPPEDRQGAACGAEDEVAVGGFDDAGYAADCLKAWAISLGKADGSFGENDPLLRSQVSSLLARLLERDGVALDNTRSFPDVNPDTVPNGQVRSEIEHLAGAGIIAGFPDGTFGPAGSLSVAQAATFVVRTIQFAHAHNPTAPNLHDKGNTRANYDYAIRQLLLDTSAADINTEPYAGAPTDPTARGLLADSLSRALGRLGKVFVLDCKAAQDQGVAPLHRGDPYYRPPLDPDGDGTAC